MMLTGLAGLLTLVLSCLPAFAQSWSGGWDTRWSGGGTHMDLVQDGQKVTGTYPLYGGRINAQANGRALDGTWSEGPRSGTFHFDMAVDEKSFTGRFDTGEWWTGGRGAARPLVTPADQSGVRETLRTFLTGGNLAHSGLVDQLGLAVEVMNFGAGNATMAAGEKVSAAKSLFDLVNLTTVQLWSIPGKRAPGNSASLVLHQAGTDATLPLTFSKVDGKWWLDMPSEAIMNAARTALLARYGGRAPAPEAYRQMHSARDALTTFEEAFSHWNAGGAAQALGALDTGQLAPATRTYEGMLAVQYLKRVLDRIGNFAPQEIPDDPNDRMPFIRFAHPAGQIVLAPTEENGVPVWRFTPATVRDAASLFAAVHEIAPDPSAVPTPPSPFFGMRRYVAAVAPVLLAPAGAVEAWQIVVAVLFLALCLVVALAFVQTALAVIRRVKGQRWAARALTWPLCIAITALLFKLAIPLLGWPEQVRSISAPVHALIIAGFGIWSGWLLIDVIAHSASGRAESRLDSIVTSLVLGALRLSLVFAAVLYAANQLSIPTNGIIAGLGISGLAVAFASKETLSNVFGAAILAMDHPFKRGDWIVADAVQGTVEHVGIRSTRVRTAEDTILVVPNGKLADASINNWGTRRHRLSKAKLLLGYGGTPKQLDEFIAGLREMLLATPEVVDRRTQIGVTNLSERGIEVDVTFYLDAPTLTEERRINHTLLLQIISLAESLGLRLGA